MDRDMLIKRIVELTDYKGWTLFSSEFLKR